MIDITRARNCLRRYQCDIDEKEGFLKWLTEFTCLNGRGFGVGIRSWGIKTSMAVKSLYPDDIIIIGNSITTKDGKQFLDKLQQKREELFVKKPDEKTFTITISRDVHKYILQHKFDMQDEYHINIPLHLAAEDLIRKYGIENEKNRESEVYYK